MTPKTTTENISQRLKRALENGAADTSADCADLHERLIACVKAAQALEERCVEDGLWCTPQEQVRDAITALSEVLDKEGK